MQKIITIVEGNGEVPALPILLRRLVYEESIGGDYSVDFPRPLNAHGRGNLLSEGGLERFLKLARIEGCDGVLILIDSEGDCAVAVAKQLAGRAEQLGLPFPVAVVCAVSQYEAWFLASLESLVETGHSALDPNAQFDGDAEALRDVKTWLTANMPPGRAYKETQDQPSLTNQIDIELARKRSRSFQRLVHALEELLSRSVIVSPASNSDTS